MTTVGRVGARLTLKEQLSRPHARLRNRPLAMTLVTPKGNMLRACDVQRVMLAAGNDFAVLEQGLDALTERVDELRIERPVEDAATPSLVLEMIHIPGGRFSMGTSSGFTENERPSRRISVSEFAIGKYPVTIAEYMEYLRAIGHPIPQGMEHPEESRYPVAGANWYDAVEYCEWLSRATGRSFRLPTEAEWEYVAGGSKRWRYPWGNRFDVSRIAHTRKRGVLVRVDSHPTGSSFLGVFDLIGNVWEWTGDWFARYDSPALASDLDNPRGPAQGRTKVLRGGYLSAGYATSSITRFSRYNRQPGVREAHFGFRVAEDLV